ncbi:MAG: DUF2304 family protein [Candidatus Levybacteria bacterium]|nr:DUF2304 family protein [Candidatus Levybacteria bacterium]
MKISIYQIGIILISFFFIVNKLAKFFKREQRESVLKLTTTLFIWFAIIIFSLFPPLARQVSQRLGFGENLNTLIFLGFVIVFILIFKLLGIIENIERAITEIIRKEALKDIKNSQKK